jgi:hypothetical protein
VTIAALLSMSSSAWAQDEPTGKTAVAGGVGVSVGILGARVARRLGDLPLAAVLGLGAEGIAPQLQIDLLSSGNFNVHIGGGALYAPWGLLVLSQGSVVPFGVIGGQRWPYRWQHGGLFLNGDVEIVRQVRGHSEGGHENEWIPTVGGQIGATF